MSIMSEIREVAYDLFRDRGECSLAEIKREALEKGVSIPPKSTLVRSTIYQLAEKDPCIQRIDRGRYRYVTDIDSQQCESQCEEGAENSREKETKTESLKTEDGLIDCIDIAERELLTFFKELEKFKWFQSSDAEVEKVRKRGMRVKAFYDTIGEKITKVLL